MAPITINLEGAMDAVKLFQDAIIPWRRQYSERKKSLDNALRQVEIQRLQAESLSEQAKIEREKAPDTESDQAQQIATTASRMEAEAKLTLEQAEKLLTAVEKERELLRKQQIELALQIIEKYAPGIEGPEKVTFVIKLLPIIDQLLSTDLDLQAR